MPSVQAMKKHNQNYREKPVWPECRNCKHFAMDLVQEESAFNKAIYTHERNLRCTLGNFKVKKLATCDKHEHTL